MQVSIRAALPDDIPSILTIERESPMAAHWSETQYEILLETEIILIAEQSNQLCGFITARSAAGDWEIENVAVAAAFQRRGIGGRLVRQLTKTLATRRICAIFLEVRESNLPARKLYERQNFHAVGRRRGYYHDPREDAVLYKLECERSV